MFSDPAEGRDGFGFANITSCFMDDDPTVADTANFFFKSLAAIEEELPPSRVLALLH